MKPARVFAERPLALTLVDFALLVLAAGVRYDGILSLRVLANLIEDDAELGFAALGATFVLIGGGLDLSIGAVCACAGIGAAKLVVAGSKSPRGPASMRSSSCSAGSSRFSRSVVNLSFRGGPGPSWLSGSFGS